MFFWEFWKIFKEHVFLRRTSGRVLLVKQNQTAENEYLVISYISCKYLHTFQKTLVKYHL